MFNKHLINNEKDRAQLFEGRQPSVNRSRWAGFPARRDLLLRMGVVLLAMMSLYVLFAIQKVSTTLAQGAIAGHTADASDKDCIECHVNPQAGQLGALGVDASAIPIISTHGNTGFGGKTEELFSFGCMDCHSFVHGGGPNLALIGVEIKVQSSPVITTGPISFIARSGSNSYDDGVSSASSRICVACHVHPGRTGNATALDHAGGASHIGNTAFVGQNCIACHPHNPDGKSSTVDGFMPTAGCTNCHAGPMDDPTVIGPVGGRRAITSEFALSATHHVAGSVTDDDCKMCHTAEVNSHADGRVQVSNADTGEVYTETNPGDFRTDGISITDSKSLIPFCLSCHDSDGANGNPTPFSDGQSAPVITDTLWYSSSHNTGEMTNSGYGCLGDGLGNGGCHAAHGSEKVTLLTPADAGGGVNNVDQEEGFCYTCHDGAPAANMQTEFNRASHHNVLDSEPNNIECLNCHNPHQNSAAEPLSNPDNTDLLWLNCDGERDFCLACHDGSPPADVTFPGSSNGTGYDKSQYVGSRHDEVLDGPECRACHERHGSTIYSLLTGQYIKTDNNNYTFGDGDYALCFKCHREGDIVRTSAGGGSASNAFATRHNTHVNNRNSPCIHCHDAHYAYDNTNNGAAANEPGLINFVYAVNQMDVNLTANYNPDRTQSDAFYLNGTQTTGYCYLSCHYGGSNMNHNDNYGRSNKRNTADCYDCHNTTQGGRRRVIGGTTDFGATYQHLQPESGDQYTRSDDCRTCHEFATHQQGTVILKKADCNGWIECNETGTSYDQAVSLEPFCQGCHDGDGAQRLASPLAPFSDGLAPPTAGGHSNIDRSGVEADFRVYCFQCHESHGSSNFSFVKLRPVITGNTTPAVNVVFTARTGTNSFDESDSDDRDDICATCHSNGANPGSPMAGHDGGNHGAGGDYRGQDCIACHPHDRDADPTTLDGFMPDGCTDCHNVAQDEPAPATPAGGRRAIVPEFGYTTHHVSGTVANDQCQVCHATETHRDGLLQLADADNSAISYTESSPGAFRTPSGSDLTKLTSFCQSCHDGDGAQRLASPLDPFGDGQSPLTVSLHSNIDAMGVEANFQVDCVRCHNTHGSDNRTIVKQNVVVDPVGPVTSGPVVFTAQTGPDSFDEIDGPLPENASANVDDICVVCHINSNNAGFPMTYHSGGGYHLGGDDKREQNCTTCHPHDTDDNATTKDAFMPGGCTDCHAVNQDNGDGLPANGTQVGLSGGRRAVVDEFGYSSHHVTGTAVTNNDCIACHNENVNHMDGSLQMADADNSAISYTESYPGAFRVLTNTTDLDRFNAFCLSCHDGNGAQRLGVPLAPLSDGQTPVTVSLHSNIDYADREEAGFQAGCGQCHNAHGNSGNLYIVKAGVLVTPTAYITNGPVVFTALTGPNSFDEIDTPENPANNADDICVTCHSSINDMTGHLGGLHSGIDKREANCTTCHPHTADSTANTKDGFMPAGGCIDCHAGALDNGDGLPVGGRRGVVGEFGYNSHHVTGTAVTDNNCLACHAEKNGHKNGYLEMADADSTTVYTESYPGAFRALTNTTDLGYLNSFCQSCHDGNGAQRGDAEIVSPLNPFGDGQTPLTASLHSNINATTGVEEAFQGGCVQCHGAHGSSNRAIVRTRPVVTMTGVISVTDGPVTFTARTGSNSFDDLPATTTGDICAVCHLNNSMQYHDGGDHTPSGGSDERGNDCVTCHPHDPDKSAATLDAFMLDPTNCLACHTDARDKAGVGPAGGRRAIEPEFSDNSHHVIGAVSNSQCRVCHESELSGNNHADGLVHLTDPDNAATYAETYPGSYRVLTNTADLTTLTTFCQNCHDNGGATRSGIATPTQPFGEGGTPVTVSLHSNIDFFPTIEADFEVGCGQCHGGHSSSNLSIIKSTVLVTPTGYLTNGPVVFTQTTGIDSFDENDGTESAANNIDDVCVTCHSKLGAMNNHEGGIHLGGDDKRGANCTTCHSHNADTDIATKDGFMPTGGCTECHANVRDDGGLPAGGRRAVVDEFGYSTHHVTGTAVTDNNCLVCHNEIHGVNHRNDYVELVNADTGSVYTETSPGAFRAPDGSDLTNLTAFCQSCHDGNGAVRLGTPLNPFGDGQAPAGVSIHSNKDYTETGTAEADFEVGCVQCHGPHGSSNLSIINSGAVVTPTGYITNGPVVFTARTGGDSFDENSGDPSDNDDICVTCHIAINSMTNHIGGGNHLGVSMPGSVQNSFYGQDCTQCHPHDTDSTAFSRDGFMPSEGCTVCHAYIQDLTGVGPSGGRRAVMGEFISNTHHANAVTDADCKLCHSLTSHQDGYVRLKNVDTGAVYAETTPGDFRPDGISRANSQSLAPFCLACHDTNGANGDTTPFSDGVNVPYISRTLWTNSAHRTGETTNSGYGCLGDGSTTGCHDTGHGSSKDNLLAPDGVGPNTNNVNQEEGFCYTCHDGTTVSPDTQTEFGRTSRHDVNDGDQSSNGSAVECVNCHNPHTIKSSERLSNPNDLTQLWTGDYTDFCITCHDGAGPSGVTFPSSSSGTGYDKSAYPNTPHDTNLDGNAGNPDGYGCRHCHDEHGAGGTNIYALLKDRYDTNDYNSYTAGDYQLCWTCHDSGDILGNNASFDEHNKHISGERAPCIICHDVHQPWDSGEVGLVNFDLAIRDGYGGYDISHINGRNNSTSFWHDNCYIRCHGESHNPYNYGDRGPAASFCTPCHASRPSAAVNPPAAFAMAAGFEFNGTANAAVGGPATAGLSNLDSLAALAGPEVITGVVYGTAISDTNFFGDGANNYIAYNENQTSLQIGTNILIEMELTPFEIPAGADEDVIFDRGDGNYRLSIAPGDGTVGAIAFRANVGGSEKVVLSNYNLCPIKTGHWYRIRVVWDAGQGVPGVIYIDDLGGSGESEQWSEYLNCTDFTQAQLAQGDTINNSDGPFTVGANTGTKNDKFSGLIDWLRFYFKEQETGTGTPIYLPVIMKDAGG